ncbi:37S ribosomal protein S25, mitochondrial [Favolaschia claudopus]|uniref:Small ribosomal subunit protein mS23 n=1 Tax=Favolaschia claudopus TaxID=2862362 RepID=A0AAW0EF51_9AGAR
MGRRIASQVHLQVARLLRARALEREPKWYQPVLNFPPLPLPPKAPPERTSYDQKQPGQQQKMRRPKNRPLPIYYLEDDIRRQFYADHPFEAFRPTTLVEKGDIQTHEVNGVQWMRLRQRGRNPTPEDAIQFTLNLKQKHNVPLSQAYAQAVAQFRALRSEHHIATTFAVLEAEALGAVFVRGEIEHAFEKEKRALATWERLDDIDEGSLAARKRWKMIAEKHAGESQWSKGVQYVKMWQAGNRVNYSPAMTSLIDEDMLAEPEHSDLQDHEPPAASKLRSVDINDPRLESGEPEGNGDILTMEELESLMEETLVNLDEDEIEPEYSQEADEEGFGELEEEGVREGEGEEELDVEDGFEGHVEDNAPTDVHKPNQ